MEKISGNLKGVTIIQLEKWLNLQDPFSSEFKKKVSDSYRIFAELVQDRKLNQVFKKPAKVSPVEFTNIGLLIFAHKDTLTMAQLSAAIAKMRDDVRAAYVDIRMNSRVLKTMIDFIKTLKMPKIPGDTGGPAGATGSMAGLKRKRAEPQNESEDEEDKDDNEKSKGQKPKAKKKSATVSNVKPSGSPAIPPPSKAALPLRVKAEPAVSPVVPSQVSKAPPDRMAALRRAKDTIAQQQQLQQHPALLTDSQAFFNNSTSFTEPNPQSLPSPGPSFTLLSSQAGPSSSNHISNPNSYKVLPLSAPPPLPPSNAMENSLMATMMRSTASAAPSKGSDSQHQPPLPTSAGNSSSRRDSLERGSWNRDLEREPRDWDRDRDRNHASGSGGSGGRYHDHDERHHRESVSHGYGRRSSDEYDRGRARGWRV
jgi:hypothetical protein